LGSGLSNSFPSSPTVIQLPSPPSLSLSVGLICRSPPSQPANVRPRPPRASRSLYGRPAQAARPHRRQPRPSHATKQLG
jgi:hypothetical protein